MATLSDILTERVRYYIQPERCSGGGYGQADFQMHFTEICILRAKDMAAN